MTREEEFEKIVGQLLRFDNEYNELFLPLFADKEKVSDKSDIEREIINLTKQKERIKKAYMSEVVELDDFKEDLKVTIQALGWRSDARYLPLQDDISSVAYWYSDNLNDAYPKFPSKNDLEII